MKELISVIIPVYNAVNSIKKCLNSIINQTYSNLEIIVVDDGSNDGSFQAINEIKKQDDRIVYLTQVHSGASRARNYGLSVAHGDYIGFVDSDDWIESDMYESLLDGLKGNQCDIAMCGYNTIRNGEISRRHCCETPVLMSTIELLKDFFSWNLIGAAVWSKLYRKSVFDGLVFEDYSYKEDAAIMYLILAKCKKGVHIGLPKYYYVIQEKSVYRRPYDSEKRCTIKIIDDLLSYIRSRFSVLMQDAVLYSINTYFEIIDDIYKLACPQKYQNDIIIYLNHIRSLINENVLEIRQKQSIMGRLNALGVDYE